MTPNLTKRRILTTAILSLAVAASFLPSTVTAQESDSWEFRVTPYLWMLGLDGTTAVLGEDADVDASFSDILDLLNIALSVNMELSKGNVFFVMDAMYAALEMDFEGPGPVAGDIDIDLIIADLAVGFKVNENFDLYAGVRLYDQEIGITPEMLPKVTLGDDWTDFVLGFRIHNDMSEKWSFMAKVDGAVSGDSESAWYAQAVFLRHFSKNRHLDIGWRYYDVDYESGSGLTLFKWDVAHSGPVIGYSWEF
jgi:hypothetical protein